MDSKTLKNWYKGFLEPWIQILDFQIVGLNILTNLLTICSDSHQQKIHINSTGKQPGYCDITIAMVNLPESSEESPNRKEQLGK